VPGRFSIVGILALDVLAAIGLARIIVRRPRLGMALPAVAVALMLFEFLPGRVPTQPAAIPAPYSAIAGSPDGGAVLELPLQWRTGFTNFPDNIQDTTIFMYYATEHGRPLVSGMAARYPDRKLEELKLIPVYRQVLALQHAPGIESVPNFGSGDLRKAGIGFVVYHRDRPLPDSLRYFQNLGMSVLADDGSVLVWHVPASA
jgi:hypothetical protein